MSSSYISCGTEVMILKDGSPNFAIIHPLNHSHRFLGGLYKLGET